MAMFGAAAFGAAAPAPAFGAFGAAASAAQPGPFGGAAPFGAAPQQHAPAANSFGAPQPAPAFGGGFGQPQQQQQQQQQQPQQQPFGAGALGAPAAAPAQNAFGFAQPAANPAAPAFGVGGFGGGGFGAPAALAAAPIVPAFGAFGGGGFGGLQPQQQQLQMQQLPHASIPAPQNDVPYDQLRKNYAPYADLIDKIHVEYMMPMKKGLARLSSASVLSSNGPMQAELSKLRVAILKLSLRKEQMLEEVKQFQDESRQQSDDARRFGHQEVGNLRVGTGYQLQRHRQNHQQREERLPNEFFRDSLGNLETRLGRVAQEIDEFHELLNISFSAVSAGSGAYGQRVKIGAQQLVQVIQRQNEAFLRIATTVAQLHRDVEEMRREYLSLDHVRGLPNPFDQADALERKRATEKERKLRESVMREEDKSLVAGVGAAAAAAGATSTAAAPPGVFSGLSFGSAAPAPGAQPAPSMFGSFNPAPTAAAPAAPGAGMFGAAPSGFGGGFGSAAPAAAGGGLFGVGLGASQSVIALDLAKGGGKPSKNKK